MGPFNIGLKVFVGNSRDFRTELSEWFSEVGRELTDVL
jgi:hypothetical protein